MKKFLSMTLLFTAMFLTFSACSSDDDETSYPDITGSWSEISETPGEYISSYMDFQFRQYGYSKGYSKIQQCYF